MSFKMTKKKVLTRRGVLWLGQTCNLRCSFCYFMDRIATQAHPEHPFMSIEKAKKICNTLVDYYHNNSIDIQGGEPTIYPHIYELVRYCRDIGLLPTLITNALVLDKIANCEKLRDSGLRDCLVSVHGLNEIYDSIVGVPGGHNRQMKGIENLRETGIPFRFNCVLSKKVLTQLNDVARVAVNTGARVVNFIAYNPFEDQQKEGRRSDENVPKYSEVVSYLTEAMDILGAAGIEYNVRYFPICMVEERHRKAVYNFQQLPYDIHEWDYASWSWTGRQPQRMRDGDVTQVISLQDATIMPVNYPGPMNKIAGRIRDKLSDYPKLLNAAVSLNRKVSYIVQRQRTSASTEMEDSIEWLYKENAKLRAVHHCKYTYSEKCCGCDASEICDGFHGDYSAIFGTDEARPIKSGIKITDPKYYISEQEKVVESEDYDWAV